MKILYIPIINESHVHSVQAGDYQADSLFHGLRCLLGEDVVDGYKMWHLYESLKDTPEIIPQLWGKGFTIYGLLPDANIDRDDIGRKIINHYYDYLVMPIHHTLNGRYDAVLGILESIKLYYDTNEIIIVDGWDRSDINKDIASCGIYFKRELFDFYSSVALPISFSIPEEKICDPLEKSFDFAPLVPNCVGIHQDSYIYDDEGDYYDDYRKSYFAYTCKKGRDEMINEGWDCMRHYEILACGCVPFFTDIEKCQASTLTRFPKELCIEAKKISGVRPGTRNKYDPNEETFIGTAKEILPGEKRGDIDFSKFDSIRYNDIREQLIHHTRTKLTTISTAKDFLHRVKTWG
jgi:hypothetical protein